MIGELLELSRKNEELETQLRHCKQLKEAHYAELKRVSEQLSACRAEHARLKNAVREFQKARSKVLSNLKTGMHDDDAHEMQLEQLNNLFSLLIELDKGER